MLDWECGDWLYQQQQAGTALDKVAG